MKIILYIYIYIYIYIYCSLSYFCSCTTQSFIALCRQYLIILFTAHSHQMIKYLTPKTLSHETNIKKRSDSNFLFLFLLCSAGQQLSTFKWSSCLHIYVCVCVCTHARERRRLTLYSELITNKGKYYIVTIH